MSRALARRLTLLAGLFFVLLSVGCARHMAGENARPNKESRDLLQQALVLEDQDTPAGYTAAADIYARIADSNAEAAWRLARLYREDKLGTMKEADRLAGYLTWLAKARQGGWPPAIDEWGYFVNYAGAWILPYGGIGEHGAINNLGVDYYYGQNGSPQDMAEALRLFQAAARNDDVVATGNVGAFYYYEGPKEYRNDDKAVEYFTKAADNGYDFAQYFLGECYEFGRGVKQDYATAARYYYLAQEQGSQTAGYRLGKLLYDGKLKELDYATHAEDRLGLARAMFRMSGEGDTGHPLGAYMAGQMAEKGQGGPKNLVEARKWYDNAVRLGYEKAAKDAARLAKY